MSSSGRGRGLPHRLRSLFGARGSSSTFRDTPEPSSSSGSVGLSGSVHGLSLDAVGSPDSASGSAVPGVALSGPRTRVTLERDGSLAPPHKVSTAITNSFKKYIDVEGYAWRFVSDRTKRIYFEEFQKLFYWDDDVDQTIKKQWAAKAAYRYKDFVCKAKAQRHTKGRPEHIPELAWDRWCAYWDTDAAMEVSRKAKKNRLHEPAGPGTGVITHRGGSRSASAYAAAIAAERGVDVNETLLDTFYKLHRIDGRFTDPKSAQIAAEVDRIATERSQPLPDGTQAPPVDMNAIYLEVAARADKGRVFGLGSMYHGTQPPPQSSSWDSSASYPPHPSQASEEIITELRAEAVDLRRRVEMNEAENARNRCLIQKLLRHMGVDGEGGSSTPPDGTPPDV